MFSAFFMKAYRRPREFGWWTGIILLLFGLGFGFSGYLLPMDNLGFFATKVGMAMVENVPFVGNGLANMLRGGLQVGDNAAARFFTLHVSVMPIFFIVVLGLHLYLVQKHGMSIPPSEEAKDAGDRKKVKFIPDFAIRDLVMWLMTLNVIAVLAWRFPWELGVQASALAAAPAGIHPEWYFMSSFQLLKVVGAFVPGSAGEAVGMIIFSLGLILWILVPLFDVKTERGRRGRIATYCGLAVLFILVSMTIWGYSAIQKGAHTMKVSGQGPAPLLSGTNSH
jgi:cytochrome b6